MKDEIKEIINDLQRVADRKCYPEDILDGSIAQEWIDYILDYITNLQKENEKLREIVENLTTMTVCGDRKQIKNTAQYKLDIAQQKIDKAIEFVEQNLEGIGYVEVCDLLNILQGEDKDE